MKNEVPVLFQNQDYIAVNKGVGISVHNQEDQVNLLQVLEKQFTHKKFFPVHRLDKETSGIQILALHSESARYLAQEFENKSVHKIYYGIVRGQLKDQSGHWKNPLTDKAEGRRNPEGLSRDRVSCETKFRVIKSSKYFTYCHFDLITGRQHQIRKHAAVNKHHLIGDQRYGDPKYNAKISDIYQVQRMFLHCARLEILGQSIECPEPKEFHKLFEVVKS